MPKTTQSSASAVGPEEAIAEGAFIPPNVDLAEEGVAALEQIKAGLTGLESYIAHTRAIIAAENNEHRQAHGAFPAKSIASTSWKTS